MGAAVAATAVFGWGTMAGGCVCGFQECGLRCSMRGVVVQACGFCRVRINMPVVRSALLHCRVHRVRGLGHGWRHDAHGHGVAQQAAQDQREDQQTGQEGAHGSVGE